jgi:hypothetical protein
MEALIGEETEGGEEGDAIMVLYFTLKGKVEGRKTRGAWGGGRTCCGCEAEEALEVGDDADRRVRAVSEIR